ncbi:hypothetical protein DPMN_036842 [Dreissena polymorpha]|uniref:Uncharacterized protein n=1 Tax=Dreissena polymorpha TaxID=45954 RepID=A0A9D4MCB4_DREPO|nr:hypothetical protein DPMN_036842 [Dreissena polymorpha]
MSLGWRKAAEHVPVSLQHRPFQLVQHMKDVETKALSITADYITRLDEISFIVRSGAKVYPICLGTEATMPSCECRPFRKTHMPVSILQQYFVILMTCLFLRCAISTLQTLFSTSTATTSTNLITLYRVS